MISQDIIKRVKSVEIKTRHIVNSTFTGDYHSSFKGQGISFADIREYTPGDDIRFIDWKVTARVGAPFVKQFEEERELTVIIMVDLSASGNFGSESISKIEVAAEIATVLGFSAVNNQDKVGLLLFSDYVERYVPPKRGRKHMFRLISEIFGFPQQRRKTSIKAALSYLLKVQKRSAIVFLVSDFLDDDYQDTLGIVARRHDLIPIVLEDPKELSLPNMGMVMLEDSESGDQMILNTSSGDIRRRFEHMVLARKMARDRIFKLLKLDSVTMRTDRGYLDDLVRYFKQRIKRLR